MRGAVYLDNPSDVPSTVFTLRVTTQGLLAYSNDFDNSKLDQYRIAVNSILPHAITWTFWNNQWVVVDCVDKVLTQLPTFGINAVIATGSGRSARLATKISQERR
jgi:hypothetical protein